MARTQSGARARVVVDAPRRGSLHLAVLGALGAAGALAISMPADARITKVEITSKVSPAFGGYAFAGVGQYEKIVGKAFGELDPNDPRNALIVDIQLAPRNANGKVEYSHDFYILKPIDLGKGNHKLMYDPPNRGSKTFGVVNRGLANNDDPGAVTDPAVLANTFLLTRGYSMAWSGWDFAAGTNNANFNLTIALPVARNLDGSTITGPAYEYIVSPGASYALNYAAATLDQSKATLTHRVHLDDVPQTVPASGWQYNATGTAISLVGASFVANDIYEFSYTAKEPTVNGIGFAAIRDFNAWLKYETKDDAGTVNPLAGDVTRIYTLTRSQPARLLNDFRNLGFNQGENGKKVFDAMLQWVGAADGITMNYRFSQPGRTERNRQDQLYVEGVFPFANEKTTDSITGKTAGRYDRCTASDTCPLAMEIWSSNEYWVKAASLFHTDTAGTIDLPGHPLARLYLISSHQHSGPGNVNSKGLCQQFGNPLDSAPVQRALWDAMDQWSTKGVASPPSAVPRLADGTLVPPLPQLIAGYPKIPGVTYTGLKTTRYLLNYGPNFYATGVATVNPPVITPPMFDNPANGPIYQSLVPKTDADGNEIAGIRLPDMTVPIRSYSGWSLRAGAQANDGCESSGQSVAFAKTKAERIASGDPRLSIEERYPSFSAYYYQVKTAIDDMIAKRYLLAEDAGSEFNRMLAAGLGTGAIKLESKEDISLLQKAVRFVSSDGAIATMEGDTGAVGFAGAAEAR